MSKKAHEEHFVRNNIIAKVQAAMDEVKNGAEILDGKETLAKLKAKHAK